LLYPFQAKQRNAFSKIERVIGYPFLKYNPDNVSCQETPVLPYFFAIFRYLLTYKNKDYFEQYIILYINKKRFYACLE